jgi:hypothetical protein
MPATPPPVVAQAGDLHVVVLVEFDCSASHYLQVANSSPRA